MFLFTCQFLQASGQAVPDRGWERFCQWEWLDWDSLGRAQ